MSGKMMRSKRIGRLARDEASYWLFGGPLPIDGVCDIFTEYANTFEGVCLISIANAVKRPEHEVEFDVPLCMLPDGNLVSQQRDHTIVVWSEGRNTHTLKGHTERVTACILLPNDRLASASADGTVRVFDLATQTCVWVFLFGDGISYPVNLVALPNDVLAACHSDGTIRVWSMDDESMLTFRDHYKPRALALLPNGLMASCSHDCTVRLWDLTLKSCVGVLTDHEYPAMDDSTPHIWEPPVMDLIALPDGRLASCGDDWTVRIWDPTRGVRTHVLEGHTRCVVGLAVLSNGLLVSAAYDHTFRVWDTDSGSCVMTRDYNSKTDINSMTAMPNCQLAVVYFDGTADIWG